MHARVCHAGAALSLLTPDRQNVTVRGRDLADPSNTPPPTPSAGTWDQTVIGAKMLDAQLSAAPLSCPWLCTCSAAEKSAPSPTLHYDKSRQAAVPLAHHSTVSLPWQSNLHRAELHTLLQTGTQACSLSRVINKLQSTCRRCHSGGEQ